MKVTNSIDLNYSRIKNLASPSVSTDAANKDYVDTKAEAVTALQSEVNLKVPTTRAVAGMNLSADITVSDLLSALGLVLTTIPIIVSWNGSSWGSYSTDTARVRLFMSQNDTAASAPISYNNNDLWFGASA